MDEDQNKFEEQVNKLCQQISARLKAQREIRGWTVKELARVIDRSIRTVNHYEGNSREVIPTASLVRLMLHEGWGIEAVKAILGFEDTSDVIDTRGFRYKKKIPDRITQYDSVPEHELSNAQREQAAEFQHGVTYFEQLFEQGISLQSLFRKEATDVDKVYAGLRSVFVNHVVQFSKIKQDEELAELVREKFNLRRVLVADVRTPPGSEVPFFDCTPLRVELAAGLAAHEAFSCLWHPKGVLLGSGYTVMRMLNNSLASSDQFTGTTWIPAASYPREKGNAADHSVTPHYSANYLATYLAGRFGRSEAVWFPYMEQARRGEKPYARDTEAYDEVKRLAEGARYAFISLMGMGRKDGRGNPYRAHDGLAADMRDYGQLQSIVDNLQTEKKLKTWAGEIIGHFVDDKANPLRVSPELAAKIDRLATKVSLDTLRSIRTGGGEVWVIAARSYKARAVKMAVVNGLANCLVIDSEIAEMLRED